VAEDEEHHPSSLSKSEVSNPAMEPACGRIQEGGAEAV
jgi:hypothetical protein